MGWLEVLLAAVAGLFDGFVSTLASNGSAVTLPALESLGAGLVVLGSGFFLLAALVFLTGCDLRHGNAIKAFVLLVVGLQILLIFGEAGEVDWIAGIPLALGSAAGAYAASLLAAQDWARVWVYRFLVLVVIMAMVHLLVVDTHEFLGRGIYLLHY